MRDNDRREDPEASMYPFGINYRKRGDVEDGT